VLNPLTVAKKEANSEGGASSTWLKKMKLTEENGYELKELKLYVLTVHCCPWFIISAISPSRGRRGMGSHDFISTRLHRWPHPDFYGENNEFGLIGGLTTRGGSRKWYGVFGTLGNPFPKLTAATGDVAW
jgi:hypothetical protein